MHVILEAWRASARPEAVCFIQKSVKRIHRNTVKVGLAWGKKPLEAAGKLCFTNRVLKKAHSHVGTLSATISYRPFDFAQGDPAWRGTERSRSMSALHPRSPSARGRAYAGTGSAPPAVGGIAHPASRLPFQQPASTACGEKEAKWHAAINWLDSGYLFKSCLLRETAVLPLN